MTNTIKKGEADKVESMAFYGFIVLYSACLIYLCYELNVWEDETYTLHTTSLSLPGVINKSYHFEGQPPVYFLLLRLWRCFNSGIFFARLFSLISIGTAAYFFYRIVCFISVKKQSRWLVAIFLLNPFTVWAGLEIRVYAFLILLSSIAIWFFIRFYTDNKKKDLYIFLIVGLIGVYTQYFFTLEIAALAFSLLVFKGWKAFFNLCLYLLPVVLLFLPNLIFLPNQLHMHQYHLTEYSFVRRFSAVLYSPQNFLLALQLVPFDKWIRLAIKLIFIVGFVYIYIKTFKKNIANRNLNLELFNVLLLGSGILVLLYGIILVISDIVYLPRYMAIGLPLFILLFTLFKQYSSAAVKFIYGVICLYFILLLIVYYINPVKDYDYKRIARHINKIERKGEPILFYNSIMSLPFTYYYTGKNRILPLPDTITFDSTYQKNIKDTVQLKQITDKISTASNSYLLITNDLAPIELNMNMNREMINDYIKIHYATTLDTLYYGRSKGRYLRIRRLEKK